MRSERGWWADMLRPLLGASAERLQLKPIFISSPTLVAQSAFRMYFVTGKCGATSPGAGSATGLEWWLADQGGRGISGRRRIDALHQSAERILTRQSAA